jgi:hypothetical protein
MWNGSEMINFPFNNISVISWRSVLLVDETGENHLPVSPKALGVNLSFVCRHILIQNLQEKIFFAYLSSF